MVSESATFGLIRDDLIATQISTGHLLVIKCHIQIGKVVTLMQTVSLLDQGKVLTQAIMNITGMLLIVHVRSWLPVSTGNIISIELWSFISINY